MARNGLGTYILPAGQPVIPATIISSVTFNLFTSDIATALTTSICTDGQTPMGANLSMGSNKITGLALGVLPGDAVNIAQLGSIGGAALIYNGTVSLDQILKNNLGAVRGTIALLKAIDKTMYTQAIVTGYYAVGDGGGGEYWMDSTDTTSLDNGGSIIVATDGGRWKLVIIGGAVNVQQFGARADAKTLSDGVITSGSAVFSSASSTFVTTDVGKIISVKGAGVSGGTLSTTILTYTSPTSVVLTVAAGTSVTGADAGYGTDDTIAVQSAINFRGPSISNAVYFPSNRVTLISGKIFLPSKLCLNLNAGTVIGNGINTIFETGYWSGSSLVTNFGQPSETQICFNTKVTNGLIRMCSVAFNLFNFCENSVINAIHFDDMDQAWYAKRCFYGTFTNCLTRSPRLAIGSQTLPAYHFDDSVNANTINGVFVAGFATGWKISGSKDNFLAVNCGAESCTNGVLILNSTSAMKFLCWYSENITTAFNFDSGGNHENIVVDDCWFNNTTNAISGNTILSGKFCLNNKFNTPANFILSANFSNGMLIEIPGDSTSVSNVIPAIPAVYSLGDTIRVDYVKSIYNSATGLVVSKAQVHSGVNPMLYGGSGGIPTAGTIPFCTVTVTSTTVTIDTKINFSNYEFINYALGIVDGGTILLSGRVVFTAALADAAFATKTVTASNNSGFVRLVVSGLTNATACTGIVRHQ
jgi:hypothetical protein